MPVLIPIVAAVAAYAGSAMVVGAAVTAGIVAAGSIGAIVVGVVAGAVIGAAVGAIGAAVTGGDIGEGALWGAVGGAVAGGFAGFSAGGSAAGTSGSASGSAAVDQSAMHALNGQTAATATQSTGTSLGLGSLSEGSGLVGASAITTGGQALSGYAQGEAAEEAAKEQAEAADKARKEEFEQRMKEIYANHELRMSEIGAQTDSSLALADKNNASAMEQLNTRIGAEKDAVNAGYAREDEKVSRFNSSILGTDANLFNRPTFSFNTGAGTSAQETEFDSGFEEAVAAKTGTAQPQSVVVGTVDPDDPNKLKVA